MINKIDPIAEQIWTVLLHGLFLIFVINKRNWADRVPYLLLIKGQEIRQSIVRVC